MTDKLYAFNYVHNRDKAFANLISIIDGILADGRVKDEEVLYLDTWLLETSQIIRNGVIKSLRMRISKILSDGVISKDECNELKQHLVDIQKEILDLPDIDFYSKESDLHLLNGLCKGLISDRELSDNEIRYLEWWLAQNGALRNNYPGRELYALVKDILDDGQITQQESDTLHKALVDFTGCDLDCGVADGLATRLPLDDYDDPIEFKGKRFCLTGGFVAGKRADIARIIEQYNGVINSSVTMDIDYLVIGTLSSRDWRFSSHGRKIEKAVLYRDKGCDIKIVSEEMLFNSLP
ncbi:BRCT domain-containing protein [Plesiomonas shigelloides]|uniref:BRCT domain-containing protein n=1 Tax=Plesiomonas shigelloides TaxID=703 RepID=UPI00057A567F|nr:BRCT domain-containing protein [Plesiomonas shigelloides]